MSQYGDNVMFLLTDHLGSSSIVTDAQGAKIGEVRYKAWGETRYDSGNVPTKQRFTGQREDSELGLIYYGARWYNSSIGRFNQADSFIPQPGNPLAWDRFAYTLNNPVRYNDPSGHDVGRGGYGDARDEKYKHYQTQGHNITFPASLEPAETNTPTPSSTPTPSFTPYQSPTVSTTPTASTTPTLMQPTAIQTPSSTYIPPQTEGGFAPVDNAFSAYVRVCEPIAFGAFDAWGTTLPEQLNYGYSDLPPVISEGFPVINIVCPGPIDRAINTGIDILNYKSPYNAQYWANWQTPTYPPTTTITP